MTGANNSLTYDIVVATRNRADALEMSLPLMIRQSRKPRRIIVVDSSDDHQAITTLIGDIAHEHEVEINLVWEAEPNSARQRNLGLNFVSADVVMFPDDDSLWHEGVAEHVMRIYERDEDEVIGGVCARPTIESPLLPVDLAYRRNIASILKACVQPYRNKFEDRAFPRPFNVYAHNRWPDLPEPGWLTEEDAILVENMAGFRMSFRTRLIKEKPFDEVLGYRLGYALHEDMDASIGALKAGKLLVGALNARVYHHSYPERRAPGYDYGFKWILNYVYVVKKNMTPGSREYRLLNRYLLYKLATYATGIFSAYKRRALRGAIAAYRCRSALLNAEPSKLAAAYRRVVDDNLVSVAVSREPPHLVA